MTTDPTRAGKGRAPRRPAFRIGDVDVAPGSRATVPLPVSVLSDHTPANLSVHVLHGRQEGPTGFVSAAVHGDEVIGVEIARRLLSVPAMNNLRGTLVVVPIVNAFGFLNRSRYLPDRRDLNRSFPGSPGGSLAARLAHLFLNEVVARCSFGIDLHSAAIHRTNLPQIRISPGDSDLLKLARSFGPPVVMVSSERAGSLRAAARERNIEMLLYEAGEGLRFDEPAVRTGVRGVLRVLHAKGMMPGRAPAPPRHPAVLAADSTWLRAPMGGLLRSFKRVGDQVRKDETVAEINDPFGEARQPLEAPHAGIVIGRARLPVVNEGDALYHLAKIEPGDGVAFAEAIRATLADEDEII